MSIREKVLTSRLLIRIQENPLYAEAIGLEAVFKPGRGSKPRLSEAQGEGGQGKYAKSGLHGGQ